LPLLESYSDDMCHLSQSLEFEFLVNFNNYDCLQYDCLLNTAHEYEITMRILYTPSIKIITLMIHTNSGKTSTIF
jgi:hypothetical protein